MTSPRVEALRAMLGKNPGNVAARFGLANELMKLGAWEEARAELEQYLGAHDDEGNAWGRLAECLERLGRDADAQEALRKGIAAATRHGHPGMAAELGERLESSG